MHNDPVDRAKLPYNISATFHVALHVEKQGYSITREGVVPVLTCRAYQIQYAYAVCL